MSTAKTVPVIISPEALAFVEQFSQREELGLNIDRAKRIVPGLSAIDLALDEATAGILAGVIL